MPPVPDTSPARLTAVLGGAPQRGAPPRRALDPPRYPSGGGRNESTAWHGLDPPTVPLPLLLGPTPGQPSWSTEDGTGADAAHASARGGRSVAGMLRALVPAGWRGARTRPSRTAATALVVAATVAAVLAAAGVWAGRPQGQPVGGLPTVLAPPPSAVGAVLGGAPSAAADAGTGLPLQPATPTVLVVSVSGRVARPGLVEVAAGSRVADVLDAAGGALPGTDLTTLNLARRVSDGEQVAVGVPPAPDAVPAPDGAADPTGGGGVGAPVDLNSATAQQLDTLPGVGPVTAERIVAWRAAHGRFNTVEQLREIEGIGEQRFARLRELVRV